MSDGIGDRGGAQRYLWEGILERHAISEVVAAPDSATSARCPTGTRDRGGRRRCLTSGPGRSVAEGDARAWARPGWLSGWAGEAGLRELGWLQWLAAWESAGRHWSRPSGPLWGESDAGWREEDMGRRQRAGLWAEKRKDEGFYSFLFPISFQSNFEDKIQIKFKFEFKSNHSKN